MQSDTSNAGAPDDFSGGITTLWIYPSVNTLTAGPPIANRESERFGWIPRQTQRKHSMTPDR